MTREILTSDRTYYVRTDGSDSNDGLSDNSGGAFLTIQKAADTIMALDLMGYNVTIQVGAGSYSAGCTLYGPVLGAKDHTSITIIGDTTTPSNVTISTASNRCFFAYEGGKFTVKGFKITGNGGSSGGLGLRAEGSGSYLYCNGKMEYGTLGVAISGERMGTVFVSGGDYTISGNQYYHAAALQMGHVLVYNCAVTLSGTPAWGSVCANADRNGTLEFYNDTFSGSATGKRYNCTLGGLIFTGNAGANYFPGNSAGTPTPGTSSVVAGYY